MYFFFIYRSGIVTNRVKHVEMWSDWNVTCHFFFYSIDKLQYHSKNVTNYNISKRRTEKQKKIKKNVFLFN